MTDQSPTREELIERLERAVQTPLTSFHFKEDVVAVAEAISLLRSDSQRIAELEGEVGRLRKEMKKAVDLIMRVQSERALDSLRHALVPALQTQGAESDDAK